MAETLHKRRCFKAIQSNVVVQSAVARLAPLARDMAEAFSRRRRGNSLPPWLLLPPLFAGTASGVVLIVAMVHH
jgi:hypothetical protein